MRKTSKNIRRVISLITAAVMLTGLCGCAGSGVKSMSLKSDEIVKAATGERTVHFTNDADYDEISYSGLIMLLLDKTDYSVGVKVSETAKSTLWRSLPADNAGATLPAEASVVSLNVIFDEKIVSLNSQDDSVACSTVSFRKTDNGVEVIYLITNAPDKIKNIDTGAGDDTYLSAASDSILFRATVSYKLEDGCLSASLKLKNLGSKNAILESVGFLDYFGANTSASDGDFLLVPDGSGALVNVSKTDSSFEPLTFAVYGNDLGGSCKYSAVVPAYGMKCGESAFAAIIEKGDALASITAHAASSGDYNRIGARFNITATQTTDDKKYYSSESYEGEISLCFRFLKSSNASYAGMAAVCREQLVRSYVLSTRSVKATEYLPLCVELVGSANKGGFLGSSKKLTTYDEARDIVARLKSKGVNNIFLRYRGALSGGIQQTDLLDATLQRSLGGKKDYEGLDSLVAGQKLMLFTDINLLTMANASKNTVSSLDGGKAKLSVESVFAGTGFGNDSYEVRLRSLDRLEKTVLDVLNDSREFQATGFCLSDVGSILYSDFSASINRQEAADLILDEISPLATKNMVMVDTGNFKTLKNADVVSNLAMTSAIKESEAYTSVPFVQMILHGIVDFAPQGINLSSEPDKAFLKCIEYGALPSFIFTNSLPKDNEKFAALYGYENWLSEAVDDYTEANEALADLRGSRITDHFAVSEGVYCTEYESTTRIYVNYTDKAFAISGIEVAPMSFFRFN